MKKIIDQLQKIISDYSEKLNRVSEDDFSLKPIPEKWNRIEQDQQRIDLLVAFVRFSTRDEAYNEALVGHVSQVNTKKRTEGGNYGDKLCIELSRFHKSPFSNLSNVQAKI